MRNKPILTRWMWIAQTAIEQHILLTLKKMRIWLKTKIKSAFLPIECGFTTAQAIREKIEINKENYRHFLITISVFGDLINRIQSPFPIKYKIDCILPPTCGCGHSILFNQPLSQRRDGIQQRRKGLWHMRKKGCTHESCPSIRLLRGWVGWCANAMCVSWHQLGRRRHRRRFSLAIIYVFSCPCEWLRINTYIERGELGGDDVMWWWWQMAACWFWNRIYNGR